MKKIKDWFNNTFLPLWRAMWKHPVILFIVKCAKWFWDFLGSDELITFFPMVVFVLWALITRDFFACIAMIIQGLILLKMVIKKCSIK